MVLLALEIVPTDYYMGFYFIWITCHSIIRKLNRGSILQIFLGSTSACSDGIYFSFCSIIKLM